MDKRKIGVTILILSLLFGIVVINLIGDTRQAADEGGCFQAAECNALTYSLNASHIGIGLLFAFFALGAYLIVFGRTEEMLLKKLQEQKSSLSQEEKLHIISLLLSENEKKIFDTITRQDGITQNTLRLKTDLSKATVSQILADFEKKNIITRESKGKTYAIHIKHQF